MLTIGCALPTGCVSSPAVSVRADRYRIEADIQPATHSLRARATLDLVRNPRGTITTGDRTSTDGPATVELVLHPALRVTRVRAAGATVTRVSLRRLRIDRDSPPTDHEQPPPNVHCIQLDRAADAFSLSIEYEGSIEQDPAAGERPGEIHNFEMRADIRSEGVYLSSEGHWYPAPAEPDDAPPPLSDFTLLLTPVDGFEFVAGAQSDASLEQSTGRRAWRSPFPLPGLVLVGGPHEVHTSMHGDVTIRAHLKSSQSQHAEGLLAAVERNFNRYEPLIGAYPAKEFSIVDNYFSSGFALPTFTLLSSAVIDMGERSQTTHGYLDHEMLHSWWGNGIFVDPRDGNWCESLTSYATNYYGFVLDGNADEARRKRRNYSHFLSRIKPEDDKPLGTFDRPNGCGRNLAYNKGAMVFHMLATSMGQDHFWNAMRRFSREYVGKYASWEDIRRLCEAESGRSLDPFFQQWVRRGGAPTLSIESAKWNAGEQSLSVTLAPGAEGWNLEIPIRVTSGNGVRDVVIPLSTSTRELKIPLVPIPITPLPPRETGRGERSSDRLAAAKPLSVELDPDYQLFRKIPIDRIVPTTTSTRTGHAFTCVLPPGDAPDAYRKVQAVFDSGFATAEKQMLIAGSARREALAERTALILGDAVRDPYISAFLSAIEFPITWEDESFEYAGVTYDDPTHAVLCTVRHPGVPGGGVTVVYGNSVDAVPRAANIPMYEHSLVIFESGRPILREDFEPRQIVPVE